MRARRWQGVLCGALLTTAMATSCGSHRPSTYVAQRYAGPLRSRDIERGGHIFRTFCNPCHAGRVTPDDYLWSPAQMRRQIREGNRAMPAIRSEFLSNEDMEAVLAFLTVIGAVEAPLPDVEDEHAPTESALRPSPQAPIEEASTPASPEAHIDRTDATAPAEAAAPDRTATDAEDAATESDEAAPPALDESSATPSPADALADPSER